MTIIRDTVCRQRGFLLSGFRRRGAHYTVKKCTHKRSKRAYLVKVLSTVHVDFSEGRLLEEIHCLQLSHAANQSDGAPCHALGSMVN